MCGQLGRAPQGYTITIRNIPHRSLDTHQLSSNTDLFWLKPNF